MSSMRLGRPPVFGVRLDVESFHFRDSAPLRRAWSMIVNSVLQVHIWWLCHGSFDMEPGRGKVWTSVFSFTIRRNLSYITYMCMYIYIYRFTHIILHMSCNVNLYMFW